MEKSEGVVNRCWRGRDRGALLLALLLGAFWLACGPNFDALRQSAEKSLHSGNYAAALETCNAALEVLGTKKADPKLVWGFERIRLEAYARLGDGFQTGDSLLRLEREFPSQINASLYLTLAEYLRETGEPAEALQILATGDKKFPDASADFRAAIEDIKNESQQDEAVVEQLKKLGYL